MRLAFLSKHASCLLCSTWWEPRNPFHFAIVDARRRTIMRNYQDTLYELDLQQSGKAPDTEEEVPETTAFEGACFPV